MSFLQPWMLFALPAVFLPVLIHLLNRLRYRSVKWGAMMFLIAASRSSTRRARLRHYLLLLCRMLLLLFLILALSRPVIGGWMGVLAANAPETVILLLDRSASMEAVEPNRHISKREHALQIVAEAATSLRGNTRLVLIENALRAPQEIANPAALAQLSLAGPTDTAADWPAMFRAALDYILRNRPGRTEIWVVSDLQQSNWRPASREWATLTSQLAALPQAVHVFVLPLSGDTAPNRVLSLQEIQERRVSGRRQLDLLVKIQHRAAGPESIPLTLVLDGIRSPVDLELKSQELRYRAKLNLASDQAGGGWGTGLIPADGNALDNQVYFVYGADAPRHAAVVADRDSSAGVFRRAAAPDPERLRTTCEVVPSTQAVKLNWSELALVIWQGAEAPDAGPALQAFVRAGGVVLCFPGDATNQGGPFGIRWSDRETSGVQTPFRIATWEEEEGPLARTDNGISLPVANLSVLARQYPVLRGVPVEGTSNTVDTPDDPSWHTLARFTDGKPFLARRKIGHGMVLACGVLPERAASNLGDGTVLVPMIQRLLRLGATRRSESAAGVCGEWMPPFASEVWTAVAPTGTRDYRWQAGVYRSGTRWVALNRPADEDLPEIVDREKLTALFGSVPVHVLDRLTERGGTGQQSEVWFFLLGLAMLAMIVESMVVITGNVVVRKDDRSGAQAQPAVNV